MHGDVMGMRAGLDDDELIHIKKDILIRIGLNDRVFFLFRCTSRQHGARRGRALQV